MPNNDYDAMFDAAGRHYNVDPQLLKTIFHVESGGDPNTKPSSAGALGGMQFMPKTAAQYGMTDPTDMTQAIPAAALYIRRALDANGGDPVAALRAYNGGQGGVNSPATVGYAVKAAQLYPQMGLKSRNTPSGGDDALDIGNQILGGKTPPTSSAAPSGGGADDALQAGSAILSQTQGPPATGGGGAQTPPAAPPQPNPQTGQTDTIMPGLRAAIQPSTDPNVVTGSILPLQRNMLTGKMSLAVPTGVRDLAGGLLDLAEGPITGTVTPQATGALANLMMGGPKTFGSVASEAGNLARAPGAAAIEGKIAGQEATQPGILGGQFKSNPFSKDYKPPEGEAGATSFSGVKLDPAWGKPDADPMSPATTKFVQMMQSAIADKISHGIGAAAGHVFGGPAGAVVGYMVGPIIKDISAQYGPKVAAAVWAASKGAVRPAGAGVNFLERQAPGALIAPGAVQGGQQLMGRDPYQGIQFGVGTPYS